MNENEAINHLQLNRPFAYSELQNAVDIAIKALEEIKQYKAIGTIEDFKALKEKDVAKKIKGMRFEEAICPECETELFETYWAFGGIHYCSNCGQKLDWSE